MDLRCAMGPDSSSLGRASDTDMKNVKSILRYLRGNPGIIDSAADHTHSGSCERELLWAQY